MGTKGLRRSFNPYGASECNSPNRRVLLKDWQLAIEHNTNVVIGYRNGVRKIHFIERIALPQ